MFLGALRRFEGAHNLVRLAAARRAAGLGARLRSLNVLCVYIPTGLVNPAADKVFRCNRERVREISWIFVAPLRQSIAYAA